MAQRECWRDQPLGRFSTYAEIQTEALPAVRVFGENREAAYRPSKPLLPKETS